MVFGIDPLRSHTQIAWAVIVSDAVDMVQKIGRVLAVDVEPNKPVDTVLFVVDRSYKIPGIELASDSLASIAGVPACGLPGRICTRAPE